MDKNHSCSMGCSCSCGCNNQKSNCTKLKEQIQKICFAIDETILYLDVYPCSRDALSYYHKLIAQKNALVAEYETKCGPLTAYGNVSTSDWDWIKSPWPWEYKANV